MTATAPARELARERWSERDKILLDFLTTGVEGGIAYWASVDAYRWDVEQPEQALAIVCDVEGDNPGAQHRVTLTTIDEAMRKIAGGVSYDMPAATVGLIVKILGQLERGVAWLDMDESSEYDALTADSVFQVAVLGEVIYG